MSKRTYTVKWKGESHKREVLRWGQLKELAALQDKHSGAVGIRESLDILEEILCFLGFGEILGGLYADEVNAFYRAVLAAMPGNDGDEGGDEGNALDAQEM